MENTRLSITAFACLFWLIGSVCGQESPCPHVFSYEVDLDSGSNFSILNQVYGQIQLRNLRNRKTVKLIVELFFNVDIEKRNMVSIRLVKSNRQTLRDIHNNLPAQYRVNFPSADRLPVVLKITVNGETICIGQPPAGFVSIVPVVLEHTMYTPMQTASYGNNNNRDQLQPQPVYTLPNVFQPPVQQITTVKDLLTVSDVDCGTVTSRRTRRAINGIRPNRGQFPWAAPIFLVRETIKPDLHCGSTIITIMHVITSAKCMYYNGTIQRADDLIVVPGMDDIDRFFESTNQIRYVVQVHESPEFDGFNIAVLKLNEPIRFNDLVRPICIWNEVDDLDRIVGLLGFVPGWGIGEESLVPKYLNFVVSTIIDKKECSLQLNYTIEETSRLFCANGNGGVSCLGDFGNGFVLQRGTRFYLRGILMLGFLNPDTFLCDTQKPVVYTDVAPFRFWLSHILKM